MKRFYLLMVVVCIAYATSAQNVGIGTTTPDASAQLDISSTTKGMLAPRLTMAQRDAITSPATGLLIFQTDNTPGFYYFNGTVWAAITENGSGQYWSLTGNSGTDSLTNFIGTTDNQPLVFRINDTIAGFLGNNGNVFFGKESGAGNTTGYSNVAIGNHALFNNTDISNLVAIGDSALYHNGLDVVTDPYFYHGTNNSAVGSKALYSNTNGYANTAIGFKSLYSNTTGNNNTAGGSRSLYSNTTGFDNTASGVYSLSANTTGGSNTASGYRSLRANTTGSGNTASGSYSLFFSTTGVHNTTNGYFSLFYNNIGTGNTASGAYSLFSNTIGDSNTAYGFASLSSNVKGDYNTAIGFFADVDPSNLMNTTAIGARSLVSASNCLVLGSINGINSATADTKVGIGITAPGHLLHVKGQSAPDGITQLCLEEELADNFARVKFKNTGQASYWDIAAKVDGAFANSRMNFYLDGVGEILSLHGDGNAVLMGALTQNSDMRMKTNIHLLTHSLTSLLTLKGYYYQWKDKHRDQDMQIGLLAQEVEQLFPELVEADKNGALSVNYIGLIPVIIEAIKEQQKSIDILEKKAEQNEIPAIVGKQQKTIELQQKQMATLTGLIKTLQKEVDMLKEKIE